MPDKTTILKDDYNKPWELGKGGWIFETADAWDARWGDVDRKRFNTPYPHGHLGYLFGQASRAVAAGEHLPESGAPRS